LQELWRRSLSGIAHGEGLRQHLDDGTRRGVFFTSFFSVTSVRSYSFQVLMGARLREAVDLGIKESLPFSVFLVKYQMKENEKE
jgi:hypothetical protein